MDGTAPADLYERDFYAFDDSPSLRAKRAELAAPQWGSAAKAFLDGLEADGHDARIASGPLRDPGHPYFDLDTEVLTEDWFPPAA